MIQVEMHELLHNRIEACRLHDLMRDLCLSKGKEEKFLEVVDTDQVVTPNISSVCRLAIHLDKAEVYLHECQNLRSLLFLGGFSSTNINLDSINFGKFKSLKILVLEGCRFKNRKLPKEIEKLIMLKHLSMRYILVDELSKPINKLPCLQSLDIRNRSLELPNSIHKMRHLRYLLLLCMNMSVIGGGKLKLDGLNELETLIGFKSSIANTGDLITLPKLRVLAADIHDEDSLSMIVDHILNHQEKFREISLNIFDGCNMIYSEVDGGSTLLRKTLMCRSLYELSMACRLNKLPSYQPQLGINLVSLVLAYSYIEEDPMEMLEKLPMLWHLHLQQHAFVGSKMICRANRFPQLISLELYELPNLVDWRVEEKAMPKLSSLSITRCKKLEMIPEGLKFLTCLKELNIIDMLVEFQERVDGQEGEDYHKIKHIPIVKFAHDFASRDGIPLYQLPC